MTRRFKVLIACEFSGRVRDAFIAQGFDAVSCDLLSSESPGPHLKLNVLDVLNDGWDLMIAHPPCTYLCSSGNRWHAGTRNRVEAELFIRELANAPITRIAIENPIGVLSTLWRKPDQIIQPWMFGHPYTKATCLWLKGLPPLEPTEIEDGRDDAGGCHYASKSPNRWKERSRTYTGIARAMAAQWGAALNG